MSNTNAFCPTCSPEGMLDRLEGQVRDVFLNVSFPLSLNFRLLSVMADATCSHQFMVAMNSLGMENFPNQYECPYAQPDWFRISEKFCRLSIEFCQAAGKFKPYPIYLEYPHPENIKGWRSWEGDLRYVRSEDDANPDKDVYSSKYVQYLNPVNPNNVWAFICKRLELGMVNEASIRSVREAFSVFSSEDQSKTSLLVHAVSDILVKISDEAYNFHKLLNNPQEIIADKEKLNRLYIAYCQRIYKWFDYETQNADRAFDEWLENFIQPISKLQLENYRKEAWLQLKSTGFLDDWMVTHKLSVGDEDKLQNLFQSHFVSKSKDEKRVDAFVGKYIYKKQLLPDWKEKTAAFIRYAELIRRIEEAGAELEIPEETCEEEQDSKENVIKQCIQQMIDENLLDENVQWYSIYLVLSEDYGFENGMRDFERVMKRWGFAKTEYKFSYDSLKQVNKNRIYGNCKFNQWVKLSETNQTKQFLKKYELAKRFKEVLEEKLS